jgi:serine/threonine protein phosphatase PrpC
MLHDVDDVMPIGEFSQPSGLSPKRLRSYAAAGLLVPAAIDSSSGYRYYSPGQLREAELIDALREAGVSLADIAALLREPSCDQLDAWERRVEIDATRRRQALDQVRRRLSIDAASFTSVDHAGAGKESMTTFTTVGRTDIGHVRENNEDAVVTGDRLAAVADGMGGHPGGEVAAAVAVALVQAAFTGRSLDELRAAARAANRAIWDRSGAQLTTDHSVTGELVQRGELSEREARNHPRRNILTRALGVGPDVELDSAVHPVAEGDRLLVCTDGLFNEVTDDEIAALMAATADVAATADALVDLALARGGRDNVAVVVARINT